MKRSLLFAAVLVAIQAYPAWAQETVENELEMVRKLRDKGWNDLAKLKIEDLQKRGDPSLNAALPLELARINIAIARLRDPDQRFALFTDARKQLQEFINKNPGKAEAALASAELARVTSYHGQALLSRAMREDEMKARHEKARPAETMFIQAGKDLEAAIKAIDAALPNAPNVTIKNLLEEEKKQARLDIAVNLLDQAKTYISDSLKVIEQRADTRKAAIKIFTELLKDESSQVGWLANTWLMKCNIEITAPDQAYIHYQKVMERAKTDKTGAVTPALRLMGYFHMQDQTLPRRGESETIGDNAIGGKSKIKMSPMDRLKAVQKEGEAWLKTYANYHKSYEGQGVRYELAHAYLAEADQIEKKDAKNAKIAYDLATEHFKKLGEYDGDLAEKARQLYMSIEFKTVAEGKTELKSFDQFLMKAMLDRKAVIELSGKLDAAKPTEQKKFEDERKKALKDVINSLHKALAMADTKTPIQKVDDARYYLSGAYLAYGDPYRAAIVAEALGRSRTTRRSPEGASTALQTYSALHARHPDDVSIRTRLNDMAAFILAQDIWKGDQVMSLAHYHLATAAQKEGNTKNAIKHLEQLTPEFVDYIYTQGQLVFYCQAAREKIQDKKEEKFYIDAARAALKRMPMYGKDDSPSVITMYYFAKLEDSKFMYADAVEDMGNPAGELKAIKKLTEMSKYVRDLQNQIGTLPGKTISAQNRDQIEFTMQVMLKYADLGMAEVKFRSTNDGRFDDVLKATKSVVDDAIAKGSATKGDIAMKDYRVTGDILSLALRANVQKGNIAQGQAILDVLNRLRGPEANQKPGNVVAVLLNDISAQIKAIKKEGNTETFKKTRESYTAFLDAIAKEYEKKGFDTNAAIMLAHAYNSLEYSSKAAPLFAKIKPPSSLDKELKKKTGKETDKELEARAQIEEEIGRYWAVQIEYIRALRAAKDVESLKTAEAVCNTMLKHPNVKYKLQAQMERNYLYEDTQRYRQAVVEWGGLMKALSGQLGDKEARKIYFTAYYYNARTLYKTAMYDPMIKDKQKLITASANAILKLEYTKNKDGTNEGWDIVRPLWEEFIKDRENKTLKEEYEKLKSLRPKSALERPRPVYAGQPDGSRSIAAFGWPESRPLPAPEGRQPIASGASHWTLSKPEPSPEGATESCGWSDDRPSRAQSTFTLSPGSCDPGY